jgi:hypothetical protein
MSTIDPRIQRYMDWPPLQLPVRHSRGYAITEVIGYCKSCNKPCVELRGVVAEWPNCLQVRYAGLCYACELVTTFEMRWTNDSLIHRCDAGWVEYTVKPPILKRLWNWLTKKHQ